MNSDIDSIITGNPNGISRDYFISELSDKNSYIIYYAGLIRDLLQVSLGVSVKVNYGFRESRIEIAFLFQNKLFLVKIVKQDVKLDKEAIKLDLIIDEIKSRNQNVDIFGCLLVDDIDKFNTVFASASKILKNKFILLSSQDILNKNKESFNLCHI